MKFSIDRSSENCRTPRRNPEIEAALDYFGVCKTLFIIIDNFFSLFEQSNYYRDIIIGLKV